MMDTTYDVRIYKTEVYRGSRVTTHKVRWKTSDKTWKRPFRTAAQADVFRAAASNSARNTSACAAFRKVRRQSCSPVFHRTR